MTGADLIVSAALVGSVIAGAASLSFKRFLLRREDRLKELESADAILSIQPFEQISIGTRCPKCDRPGKNESRLGARDGEGPAVPVMCPGFSLAASWAGKLSLPCSARRIEHLHVVCRTCNAEWLMHTKEGEKL